MKNIGILLTGVVVVTQAHAITISIDYTYDTNNFFSSQTARDSLQAAADRYSRVINSSLTAVGPSDSTAGWRIGFTHPGTGASFQVSTATDFASDPLGGSSQADVYGFGGLSQNTWILYAGGRSLSSAGSGGTGTGLNFTSVFNDLDGPMHRGLIDNTPSATSSDLPVWGGAISFDNDGSTNWHFDHTTQAATGTLDFYSIALHEIGHALGLSSGWNQWERFESGGAFTGPNAVSAYNADNGTSLTELNQVSESNEHWEDGAYESLIFKPGDPNLVGTVGLSTSQDLLLEPIANFTSSIRRLELTNVDVGALEDLGWNVIPEPSSYALGAGALCLLFALKRRRG